MIVIDAAARRGQTRRPIRLSVCDLSLDPASREVTRGGRRIDLTATEYRLLECLMRRPGQVLPREVLVESVWGIASEVEPNNAITAAPVGKNGARYRLGLRRLGEAEPPLEPSTPHDGEGLRSGLANCFRSSTARVLLGVLFAVVVGAFLLGTFGAFQTRDAEFLQQVLRRNNSTSHSTVPGADANSTPKESVQSHDIPVQQAASEENH